MRLTRRGLQIALGLLWLFDGALQLQPFMFSNGFAAQVISPAAAGQPGWVSSPIMFFAQRIAAHPAALNTLFGIIQLALGAALLIPRSVRPALIASLLWSVGVWWFAEGLGGLASGHASLITGAPGAALLYAVLAAAAWPQRRHPHAATSGEGLARWVPLAWTLLWLGGAALQVLPAQRGSSAIRDELGVTDGVPAWLAAVHRSASHLLTHSDAWLYATLLALMTAIGVAGLLKRSLRTFSVITGSALATGFWVLGQNIGNLYSGQATDPNTGPLVLILGLAVLGARPAFAGRRVQPGTNSALRRPGPEESETSRATRRPPRHRDAATAA